MNDEICTDWICMKCYTANDGDYCKNCYWSPGEPFEEEKTYKL